MDAFILRELGDVMVETKKRPTGSDSNGGHSN